MLAQVGWDRRCFAGAGTAKSALLPRWGAGALAEANETRALVAEAAHGGVVNLLIFAHLVCIEYVAAAGPGGSPTDAARRRGAADRAALAQDLGLIVGVKVAVGWVRGLTGSSWGEVGAWLGNAVEASKSRDAVCAFGVQWLVMMVLEVAAMAVFNGDCR